MYFNAKNETDKQDFMRDLIDAACEVRVYYISTIFIYNNNINRAMKWNKPVLNSN
jgi:hypothetical protein